MNYGTRVPKIYYGTLDILNINIDLLEKYKQIFRRQNQFSSF